MTSRWNDNGPRATLCAMLCALTTSEVGFAQTEPNGNPNATTQVDSSAPEVAADATNVAPTDPAPAPADAALPVAAPAAPKAAGTPNPPVDDAPAGTVVPLSVEILPGSGYPQPRVRGIVGGSLWMTMHGHQFPYMAPETSRSEVRIAISGSVWDDTSYARINSGLTDTAAHQTRWTNQGRAVLRATPAYTTKDGWFAQGQVELVANGDQTLSGTNLGGVDDAFVRAGKWKVFDVTVGRFQGWEVYHYGMGLDLNTFERRGAEHPVISMKPPQIYGLNYYWDRANDGAGNYAAHVYFTDYLRLEVLGQIGTAAGGANTRSTRPVAILDLGYLKVKAGWEYGIASAQSDDSKSRSVKNGFGGAVQFVANPYLEGGVNGAVGYLDSYTFDGLPDLRNSTTTKSYGGFLNGRVYGPLIVGVGANQTHLTNLNPNGVPNSPRFGKTDELTHFQGFFAVQYSFWDKFFVKFVGAHARFHFEDNFAEPPHPFTNSSWSGRLRVMYLF